MANAAISAQKIRMRRSFSIRLLPLPIFEIETIVGSKLKSRDIKRHIFGAHFSERADRAAFEGRPEALDRVGVNDVRDAGNNGIAPRPPMPTVPLRYREADHPRPAAAAATDCAVCPNKIARSSAVRIPPWPGLIFGVHS